MSGHNLFVEALTLNVTVFGDGTFGGQIDLVGAMKVRPQ